MSGTRSIASTILAEQGESLTSAQKLVLSEFSEPGGASELRSENVGSERHYWIGESQWGEPIEKKNAEAVLAVHAASGARGFNYRWL